MTEVQAILLSGGGFITINIIGWVLMSVNTTKRAAFYNGKLTADIDNIKERLERIESLMNHRK